MYGGPSSRYVSSRGNPGLTYMATDDYDDIEYHYDAPTRSVSGFETVPSLEQSLCGNHHRPPLLAPLYTPDHHNEHVVSTPPTGRSRRNSASAFVGCGNPTTRSEWSRLMQTPPITTPQFAPPITTPSAAPPIKTPARPGTTDGRFGWGVRDNAHHHDSNDSSRKTSDLLACVPSMFPPVGSRSKSPSEPRLTAEDEASMWKRRFGGPSEHDDRFLAAFTATPPPSPLPKSTLSSNVVNTFSPPKRYPPSRHLNHHMVDTPPRKPVATSSTSPPPQHHQSWEIKELQDLIIDEYDMRTSLQEFMLGTIDRAHRLGQKKLEALQQSQPVHRAGISTPTRNNSHTPQMASSPLQFAPARHFIILNTTEKALRAQIYSAETEAFIKIMFAFRRNKPTLAPHTEEDTQETVDIPTTIDTTTLPFPQPIHQPMEQIMPRPNESTMPDPPCVPPKSPRTTTPTQVHTHRNTPQQSHQPTPPDTASRADLPLPSVPEITTMYVPQQQVKAVLPIVPRARRPDSPRRDSATDLHTQLTPDISFGALSTPTSPTKDTTNVDVSATTFTPIETSPQCNLPLTIQTIAEGSSDLIPALETREVRKRNDLTDDEDRARRGIIAAMVSAEDDLLRNRSARSAKADLETREVRDRKTLIGDEKEENIVKSLRKFSKLCLKEDKGRNDILEKESTYRSKFNIPMALKEVRESKPRSRTTTLSPTEAPFSDTQSRPVDSRPPMRDTVAALPRLQTSTTTAASEFNSINADLPKEPRRNSTVGRKRGSPGGTISSSSNTPSSSRREAVSDFLKTMKASSKKPAEDSHPPTTTNASTDAFDSSLSKVASARELDRINRYLRTAQGDEAIFRKRLEEQEGTLRNGVYTKCIQEVPLIFSSSSSPYLSRRQSSIGRRSSISPHFYEPSRDVIIGSYGSPRTPEERGSRNPSRSPSFSYSNSNQPRLSQPRPFTDPVLEQFNGGSNGLYGQLSDPSILDVSSINGSIYGSQSGSGRLFSPRVATQTVLSSPTIINPPPQLRPNPQPPHNHQHQHRQSSTVDSVSAASFLSPFKRENSVLTQASTMTADIPCPWSYGLKLSDGSGPFSAAGDLGSRRASTLESSSAVASPVVRSRRDYLCLRVVDSKPPGYPAVVNGDVIVAVGGLPVASLRTVRRMLGESETGLVDLTIIRGSSGVTQTVSIQGRPR